MSTPDRPNRAGPHPPAVPLRAWTDRMNLDRLRRQLETDLTRLRRRIGDLPAGPARSPAGSPGDATCRALHRTAAALYRIDAGTYGICDACDHRIEPHLLTADPLATLCRRCRPR